MRMTKQKAYSVFDLPVGAPFEEVITQYKYRALEWFPNNHAYSALSLKKFQCISRALLVLYFAYSPYNFTPPDRLLTLDEMMSLFQFIFFGTRELNLDDDDDDDDLFDWIDDESVEDCLSCHCSDSDVTDKCSEQGEPLNRKDRDKVAVQNANELIQEEEREKKKAEKRKAQKKRRKERKRLEKTNQKKEAKENSEKVQEAKMTKDCSSESEEDLDTNSAFVAEIAKKKMPNIPVKKENDAKVENRNEDEPASRIARSRQLALRGNEMANSGCYQEAIQLFTEAIKLDPKDCRFYGNRSYCHERLENYDKALKDAEKSIQLAPNVPKGFFRKGKALSGLKRYSEAEECYETVLKLDPHCEDAVNELFVVRLCQLKQLTDMGFTKEQAKQALVRYGTVEAALEALLSDAGASQCSAKLEDVFISDEEDEYPGPYAMASAAPPPRGAEAIDVKMDPNNPEKHCSIWVGNVQNTVTEKMLKSLFSKYGEIVSIRLMPEKFCAFVNYKKPAAAGLAMRALQGADVCDANLLIRFPNTVPTTKITTSAALPKPLGAPSNEECVFWRLTGCKYGDNCRFKHIKEHRGVDRDKKK